MSGWLKKLEDWLGGGPGGDKRVKSIKWLLILGLTGVALMIASSFFNVKDVDPLGSGRASPGGGGETQAQTVAAGSVKNQPEFADYEHEYEEQLKDILSKIVGVGDVEVLVTVDSTPTLDIDKNENESQQVTNESDPKGATRHITDTTRSGQTVMVGKNGDQQPLVTRQVKPRIRGVLVVAKGADNLNVKKMIIEAVERGLEVPAYRISVAPRKSG